MAIVENSTLNFIDVFCGAGGLSCGPELAGLRCILGVDVDRHAMKTFAHNHHHAQSYCGDIKKLTASEIKKLLKGQEVHAIVGGPPCQGFSTVGAGNPNDQRNTLFLEFYRLVKELRPYFVIIENVTGLLAGKNEKTLQAVFSVFSKLGYAMDVRVMAAHQHGVAEHRRRTIIIGSSLNDEVHFPLPTHDIQAEGKYVSPVTVGQALKNLKSSQGKIYN
ncbi:MAG: DNA cytosine methyltransferase, partial [Pseudomonadota bacterium]